MNKKHLLLYGLKWNPFSPDVPTEALHVSPRLESFGWRVENLAREGGFALVTGELQRSPELTRVCSPEMDHLRLERRAGRAAVRTG